MKIGRIIVLLLVCLGLGLWIVRVETPRMLAETSKDLVLPFDKALVAKVKLSYPSGTVIELAREEENWQMVSPGRYETDQGQVQNLVNTIADLTAERRLQTAELEDNSLETYGLKNDGARARVDVELKDGTQLPSLIVGNTTPVGFSAFVRRSDLDQIIVVPLIFHTGVIKTVFDLREKKLFKVDPSSIVKIEMKLRGRAARLELNKGVWEMTYPVSDLADQDKIKAIAAALPKLIAEAYLDKDSQAIATSGLDHPTLEIRARAADGSTVGFRIGTRGGENETGLFFRRRSDGQVAKVADAAVAPFVVPSLALRDRHALRCAKKDIAAIEFKRPHSPTFTLRKDTDGHWGVEPAQKRGVLQAAIDHVIDGMISMQGSEAISTKPKPVRGRAPAPPIDPATWGLDKPIVEVKLLKDDDKICDAVKAGVVIESDKKATYFLQRQDADIVLKAEPHVFSHIDLFLNDFLEGADPKK